MDQPVRDAQAEAERVAQRADAVEAQALATVAEYGGPRPSAGRTSALSIDEVVDEARRRVALYRGAPHGANLYRADAVEAFLWWIEAAR